MDVIQLHYFLLSSSLALENWQGGKGFLKYRLEIRFPEIILVRLWPSNFDVDRDCQILAAHDHRLASRIIQSRPVHLLNFILRIFQGNVFASSLKGSAIQRLRISMVLPRKDATADAGMEVPALILVALVFLGADAQPINGSAHFAFPSFNRSTRGIVYMGNASASDTTEGINLTPDPNDTRASNISLQNCIGRVLYDHPVTIWPASFTTAFTILVRNISSAEGQKNLNAEGLAFAIFGSNGPFLPDSYGSFMGLFGPSNNGNATGQLAVEFDTYKNEWDPDANHVGIDVSSITSNKTAGFGPYGMDLKSGRPITVRVDYDGWSKNLQVYAAYADSGGFPYSLLNDTIELSNVVPKSAYLGFSAATGLSYEVHRVLNWSFSSTILPDSSISAPPAGSPLCTQAGSSIRGLMIGLPVGGSILIVGVIAAGLFAWRMPIQRRRKRAAAAARRTTNELAMMDAPHRFTYKELAAATNNFSDAELLGSGGFGSVYRGFLREGGGAVAVKRISAGSRQGEREFLSEISTIGRLRHRNLVPLQGWCHDREELLLVYEYMPNGSLDKTLFGHTAEQGVFNWQRRYKVLCGLGAGLVYLHEEWEQRVVHRDVKPSNVMLDADFNARLGDFGLARLVEHVHDDDDTPGITTMLAGTPGYVAPECGYTCKATAESDVFSFGIVALEVATGRRAVERKPALAEGNIVDRVWSLYAEGRVKECADPRLKGEFEGEQMERVLLLGLACSHPDPQLRPSMRQALQVLLNPNEQCPQLPSSRPLPIYVVLPPAPANLQSAAASYSNAAVASTSSSALSGITSITASTLMYGR